MATYLGKAGYLHVSAMTVIELRNYQMNHSSDTVEDTVIGDDYKTRRGTMKEWGVSGSLFWDPLNDAGQGAAVAALGNAPVTVTLYPGGRSSGATYYTGLCIITDVGVSASHDGMVERSFAAESAGQLSTLTV